MNKTTRIYTSTFGAIMALAGIEHGVGEALQGNTAPSGLMVLSWPDSPFFSAVGGEPAMTIVPNMLISGILTIVVSLALLAWVLFFVQRKYGSLVMVLISFGLLLVGGGIFPPVLSILVAIAAKRINAPLTWWRTRPSVRGRTVMAKLWPWFYGGGILSFLATLPGLGILGYFFGINSTVLILVVLGCMLIFLSQAMITGFARDSLIEKSSN